MIVLAIQGMNNEDTKDHEEDEMVEHSFRGEDLGDVWLCGCVGCVTDSCSLLIGSLGSLSDKLGH